MKNTTDKSEQNINKAVAIGALSLGIVGLGLGIWIGRDYEKKNYISWWSGILYEAMSTGSSHIQWQSKDGLEKMDFVVNAVTDTLTK